jgi:hypothetical protein
MSKTKTIAETELVEAEMSLGLEVIMMALLLRLGRETAMVTDLPTEVGETRITMSWIEAIGTIGEIDDGTGIGIMIAMNQSLNGA